MKCAYIHLSGDCPVEVDENKSDTIVYASEAGLGNLKDYIDKSKVIFSGADNRCSIPVCKYHFATVARLVAQIT